jgi:predicted O-methyltransferase YrrM
MNVYDFINDQSKFHSVGAGILVSHALSSDALLYLDRHIQQHSKTLETGVGVSTVLFASKGVEHICITPEQSEIARINNYCEQKCICMKNVRFLTGRSEYILPSLAVTELDLVLMDGRHAFSTPFIDWYYMVDKLKLGGIVIDDTQIWTVRVLFDFILSEFEWQLDKMFGRTAAFIKVRPENHEKWFS